MTQISQNILFKCLAFITVLTSLCLVCSSVSVAAETSWHLADALNISDKFTIAGSYRIRYESLAGQFRAGLTGNDEILVKRLGLAAEYNSGSFYLGAELQDSRAALADERTPIGTDDVNTFELLRAYVGYRSKDVLKQGDILDISLGRLTLDIGSRRLAARNGFRNTVNNFFGFLGDWESGAGHNMQVFASLPTQRLPTALPLLLDNKAEFDREDFGTVFWGVNYTEQKLFSDLQFDAYFLGLNEHDLRSRQTLNRNIYTPGFRLIKPAQTGVVDFEIEASYQFGKSSLSLDPAAPRLNHSAYTYHSHVGYTLSDTLNSRLLFQYDVASGDNDPADNNNGRYDRLFGTGGEFGPSGIFGALRRSNIRAAGARIEINPTSQINVSIDYKLAYLDSARDALTTVNLQDITGNSGKKVGSQFVARLRYDIIPGNIRLDLGGAYLVKGEFLNNAPNALDPRNSLYLYGQVLFTF